jgi:hypothetical protein
VQAPLALCGQSVLAAASLAAQPHADVSIDGRRHPLSLWAITIAESGERKSAVDRIALERLVEHERAEIERLAIEQRQYEIALSVYERATRDARRANSGSVTPSSIQDAVATCGPPPVPPPSGILICREPTIEALQRIYLTGVGSLGLLADEGAEWLGGHAMSRDHRLRTVGALSTLWDMGRSDRIRVGDGAAKIYGRRLAMHLMIQPVVAERMLSDSLLVGQGFLARALVTWPETTAGTRMYREADASSDPRLRCYHARMHALLSLPRRERDGRLGELDPAPLELAPDAKQAWIAAHDDIERAMSPGAAYSSIRPWASKGAEQVLRIAGVLSLVDEPSGEIRVLAIEAATALVIYYLGEAVRLVGTTTVPDMIRHAEAIVRWCRERGAADVDSRRLLRFGPSCTRHRRPLYEAMAELVRTGWARRSGARSWSIRIDCDPEAP